MKVPVIPLIDTTMYGDIFTRKISVIFLQFLYLQKTTFQGLSQEALQSCIESLKNAKDGIIKRKVNNILYTVL